MENNDNASIMMGGCDITESEIAAGRGVSAKQLYSPGEPVPVNLTFKGLLKEISSLSYAINAEKRGQFESLLKRIELLYEQQGVEVVPMQPLSYTGMESKQIEDEQQYQFKIGDIVDVRGDVPKKIKREWVSLFFGKHIPRSRIKIKDFIDNKIILSTEDWRYPIEALKPHIEQPTTNQEDIPHVYKVGDYVRVTGLEHSSKNRDGLMDYLIGRVVKIDRVDCVDEASCWVCVDTEKNKASGIHVAGWFVNTKDIIPATKEEFDAQQAADKLEGSKPPIIAPRYAKVKEWDELLKIGKLENDYIRFKYDNIYVIFVEDMKRYCRKVFEIKDKGIYPKSSNVYYHLKDTCGYSFTPEMIDLVDVPQAAEVQKLNTRTGTYTPQDTAVDDWMLEDEEHA